MAIGNARRPVVINTSEVAVPDDRLGRLAVDLEFEALVFVDQSAFRSGGEVDDLCIIRGRHESQQVWHVRLAGALVGATRQRDRCQRKYRSD